MADLKYYDIEDDQQFALELLRQKKVLITRGTGFNWREPDHFRIVYLPDIIKLEEAVGRISDYLSTKRRH